MENTSGKPSKEMIAQVMRELASRGGKARAKNLSADELSAIGKKAVQARINKHKQVPGGKRRTKKR